MPDIFAAPCGKLFLGARAFSVDSMLVQRKPLSASPSNHAPSDPFPDPPASRAGGQASEEQPDAGALLLTLDAELHKVLFDEFRLDVCTPTKPTSLQVPRYIPRRPIFAGQRSELGH